MSNLKYHIELAERQLAVVKELVEQAPELDAITDLISACQKIEYHYQEFCKEMDENFGDEPGTSYEEGVNIEYYIEADWWHDVSVALRKLGAAPPLIDED